MCMCVCVCMRVVRKSEQKSCARGGKKIDKSSGSDDVDQSVSTQIPIKSTPRVGIGRSCVCVGGCATV